MANIPFYAITLPWLCFHKYNNKICIQMLCISLAYTNTYLRIKFSIDLKMLLKHFNILSIMVNSTLNHTKNFAKKFSDENISLNTVFNIENIHINLPC